MVSAWPEPVQRVSSFLREAGAEARIEQFDDGTPTAAEAAAAVGCELSQIVKSIVLICGDSPVLALVPGDRRSDPAKVAHAVGADRARIASSAEVEKTTGFPPGAVAPFALRRVQTVLLDPTLLRHEIVWAGAGSTNHIVGLTPAELGRLARARTVDVVQNHPYDFASEFASDMTDDPAGDSPGDRDEPKER